MVRGWVDGSRSIGLTTYGEVCSHRGACHDVLLLARDVHGQVDGVIGREVVNLRVWRASDGWRVDWACFALLGLGGGREGKEGFHWRHDGRIV